MYFKNNQEKLAPNLNKSTFIASCYKRKIEEGNIRDLFLRLSISFTTPIFYVVLIDLFIPFHLLKRSFLFECSFQYFFSLIQ